MHLFVHEFVCFNKHFYGGYKIEYDAFPVGQCECICVYMRVCVCVCACVSVWWE
jgi:hypothetical protein